MKSSVAFLRKHALPAAVCLGVAFALAQVDTVQRIGLLTLDKRTVLRAKKQPPPDERVKVIGVDEVSVADNAFGMWPWPRSVHGSFLYLLSQEKPAVVAWDVLFLERDAVDPNNDAFLLAGARAATASTVIFGAVTSPDERMRNPASITAPFPHIEGDVTRIPTSPHAAEPLPELTSVARIGFVDTPPGSDGIRRYAYLLLRIGEQVYPGLALQAVLSYWQVPVEAVRIRLGDGIYFSDGRRERRIPIDERGRYFINYRRGPGDDISHGYYALYQNLERRHERGEAVPDLPKLEGKILLIGHVADGLSDLGPTPFSALTPLPFVHLNAIENILREDYVREPPLWLVWGAWFAVSVGGLALFSKRKFPVQLAFSIGLPLLYILAAVVAWDHFSLRLRLVGPLMGFGAVQVFMIARRVLEEQRAKAEIKGMFGTYVSPELVNRIIESGQKPKLGGHEENITAYFSDIQGFSSFSEIIPADRLVELMNEYLTACTDIVTEEGGTLDKYIGDAVVAMFGAPVALPEHAYRACVATQRVHLKLAELRAKWRAEGDKWPEIVWNMQSRIGLNSGPCIIGNMGSRTRFNYTMMGDHVNLASRMESGAKHWGVYTMCTEATKNACEEHGGDRVVFRPLGRIVVKGRTHAVPIFEIVGLKESLAPNARECVEIFSAALEKFYARDWDGALQLFAQSRELEPNIPGTTPGVSSNPSLVYLRIANEYKAAPPPENWDGVHVMAEK